MKIQNENINNDNLIKLHIGCGANYLDGWINIDDSLTNDYKLDINRNLTEPFPFKEKSVDTILDKHFYKKLYMGDAIVESMLRNYRSILKPDGIFMFTVPDNSSKEKLHTWLVNLGFPNVEIKLNDEIFIETKQIDSYSKKEPNPLEKVKLHIGCGTNYFDGWINIDNNSDNNIQKLDLNWDLRNPLPFNENSVDFIFNEHFLEHLTVEEGVKALKDFKRVLKPDGIIRIAMPNLIDCIKTYNNPNWKQDNAESFNKYGLNFIKTKAEYLNINFRWWGHQWLYDWEELERRLNEAGFHDINQCELRKSEHIELRNLETRDESNLIAEASKQPNIKKHLTNIENNCLNKDEEPILTVCLFTYNHKNYIRRAIESILVQKTDFKFKVIIADDCSTDGTTEICQEYATKYPNIIDFEPKIENIGPVDNGCETLKKVVTKYFTTLDGDDYWIDENKLQIQIDLLEKNPDCLICGHNTFYKYPDKNLKLIGDIIPNINNKFSLNDNRYLHTSSRIYRKIVDFKKFPKNFLGDICFYHIMLSLGQCIYVDKVMSTYNISNSTSTYATLSMAEQQKQSCEVAYKMLKYFDFEYEQYYINSWLYDPNRYIKLSNRYGKKNGLLLHKYFTYKNTSLKSKIYHCGKKFEIKSSKKIKTFV